METESSPQPTEESADQTKPRTCGGGSLPETERAAAETLSLPIFPGLREQEQEAVVYRIYEFFLRCTSAAGAPSF